MGFHVNEQHAHTINMVEGTQTNITGTHAQVAMVHQAHAELTRLRAALGQLANLPRGASAAATAELDGAEAALSSPNLDRRALAERLQRFAEILVRVGAVAAAGQALTGPLSNLAQQLGELGRPIQRMLTS